MSATIRSLAAACGVSVATVSRALAGRGKVDPVTRCRIEEEARLQGYEPNRLVGALMAHLRVSRGRTFVGNLAVIHVPSPGQKEPGKQQLRIIDGARQRARELGFQLYVFSLAEEGMRVDRVVRILRARGVLGLVFVHSRPHETEFVFPWEEFVVLELDFGRPEPLLHTVCHDHFLTMTKALTRLKAAGYCRASLFLENHKDARTGFRWSAAFRSFQEQQRGIGDVPVLFGETMSAEIFKPWYRAHRPDVVLGHFDACIDWLGTMRRRVPDDVGFFNLNREARSRPCAGVDPRLELQGSTAIETLVAQLQRGERGLPAVPRTYLVPGDIVEGETVRSVSNS